MAVVGPTASGKTALAIALAERINGELVSADSRQVYRDCDIGTNKPLPGELHEIPCHLVDVVSPGDSFTVADYRRLAIPVIEGVTGRGRVPILQGGTGLYVRALLDGWNLGDAPPDFELRAQLDERLAREGLGVLDAELRRLDPAAADRAQRNPRRVVRALEIHASTGRAPSAARMSAPPDWTTAVLGLDVPLNELDERIAQRVDRMLAGGLLEEVSRLRKHYPGVDLAGLGHGYREMGAVLDGSLPIEDARNSIVRQVRQYARRQLTWFRADRRVQWIPADVGHALEHIAAAGIAPGSHIMEDERPIDSQR